MYIIYMPVYVLLEASAIWE